MRRCICSLVVGVVSCSACVNRRCLRCTIWAAALWTASSWRCVAASIGLSVCLARCQCRACVTAPLMVASLTRGSLKRCPVAWCAWLWVDQPSCCRRVSARTSPLACPCLYGGGISGSVPSPPGWCGHTGSGCVLPGRACACGRAIWRPW